jgi:hypothetical protein
VIDADADQLGTHYEVVRRCQVGHGSAMTIDDERVDNAVFLAAWCRGRGVPLRLAVERSDAYRLGAALIEAAVAVGVEQ